MASFDLKHFDYQTLKTLSEADEKALAAALRQEIINDVSLNGGHLSSNLGIVELTIALLKEFDPYKDDILFDVGHQAYAYKILTGRDLSTLRQKGGVSGFQKRGESEADKFESGHSSTSLAVGLGLAAAKKLKGDTSATVIVIGDASIANGLAFEALNSLDDKTYGKLIIILNDNNMSISKPKGSLSTFFNKVRTSVFYQEGAGKFKKIFDHKGLSWFYHLGVHFKNFVKRVFTAPNFFSSFPLVYLGPIDGHNSKKTEKFLLRAKNIEGSVLLHVRTKKGKGFLPAEEDESGYWHGTSPFDPESGLPLINHPDSVSFSHLSGEAIKLKMEKDPAAVLITPAMKKGAHLEEAFKAFPERCFDLGIAEEEAIEVAGGFALKGLHPILSIYSTFMQRGYDQILNDLCRMKLSVLIVVERAGLIGQDGSSHQGIFDAGMVLSMPNTALYCPYDGASLTKLITEADFTFPGPTFIRIEREFDEKNASSEPLKEEDGMIYLPGAKEDGKILIGLGKEGKEAILSLRGEQDVVLLNKLHPLPEKLISLVKKKKLIALYDPTSSEDGFAASLSKDLLKAGYQGHLAYKTVPTAFIEHASKKEQLEEEKISPSLAVSWFKNLD
ncbi:MAG: 1-deoxy-D-xylulose-5-phosphate synthase [Bacilli bacterium]|jgi:1-deoxy-D-xylulose-5-phosphate synthase|nr:1-deoxy-D-xylulose-5-phosphate synthase [Bacilli bacterium]